MIKLDLPKMIQKLNDYKQQLIDQAKYPEAAACREGVEGLKKLHELELGGQLLEDSQTSEEGEDVT